MFKTYDGNGNETTDLKDYLLSEPTIKTQSLIIGEWNLNTADSIQMIGNYRFRPSLNITKTEQNFGIPALQFDSQDSLNAYTGATDADIVIDNGYDNDNNPLFIYSTNEKNKFYYSLEDCFNRFRPRSGINKAVFGKHGHVKNSNMANRPRYYVADKSSKFKYWTSFREDISGTNIISRGIGTIAAPSNAGYYIDDSCPFVVYKNNIYANRIIVKMQTHIGEPLSTPIANDVFVGDANKAVPKNWRIDVLRKSTDNQNLYWEEAISLNNYTIRDDGYVELVYGPQIPSQYQSIFVYADKVASVQSLPESSINGYAYLVESTNEYHIWLSSSNSYASFSAASVWQTVESVLDRILPYVTDLVDDITELETYSLQDNYVHYREFDVIRGIRIVVETMKKQGASFDLIELSPRLSVDLSDKTAGFSIEKKLSDLSTSGLPSGNILASTGTIDIFDYDQAFDKNNDKSIINSISFKNLQFKFYQKILDANGFDYKIPIKTMYADGFPESSYSDRMLQINLRDLFFYFESLTAPQIFERNKPVTYNIAMLLDSVGFSNYVFKKTKDEEEAVIPNFFVGPDTTVANVLQDIAKSTQNSMFFDEENNLIIMSKNYVLPSNNSDAVQYGRSTDITLVGSPDQLPQGAGNYGSVIENYTDITDILYSPVIVPSIANIIQIASENHDVYNDGKIVYTDRHILKNISALNQYGKLESEKSYTYQPALLWELSATNTTNSADTEQETDNSSYALSAVPLAIDISNAVPSVQANKVINNVINVGENIYWINNYSGYFLANAEIIKYDAKQYTIVGGENAIPTNVWISNKSDKDYYFSKIKYNGKMFPTGNIRIYTEVSYKENGDLDSVVKHGRGQFGTKVSGHSAGISTTSEWNTQKGGFVNLFSYIKNPNKNTVVIGEQTPTVASNTIIVKTQTQHGFSIGDSVTISDVVPIGYRGTFTITDVPTPSSFKFSKSGVSGEITTAGKAERQLLNPKVTNNVINAAGKGVQVPSSLGVLGFYEDSGIGPKTNGIIKNNLSSSYKGNIEDVNSLNDLVGAVQSSALVVSGQYYDRVKSQESFVSYSYKNLTEVAQIFGTRIRLIGQSLKDTYFEQSPLGAMNYFPNTEIQDKDNNKLTININASSGGIAVLLNPKTNAGYYFEISALSSYMSTNLDNTWFYKLKTRQRPTISDKTLQAYPSGLGIVPSLSTLPNIIKGTGSINDGRFTSTNIVKGSRVVIENQASYDYYGYWQVKNVGGAGLQWELERDEEAIPELLWSGRSKIICDTTGMVAYSKINPQDNKPFYDLKVEWEELTDGSYRFLLYINDVLVGSAIDDKPEKTVLGNSLGLFVRGTSKCMFEHVYAISNNEQLGNYKTNVSQAPKVFDPERLALSNSFKSYRLNETMITGYLSGLSSTGATSNLYFEEFGTILRECAYFNVRYDKAYPALIAKVANNYNPLLGYYVSNFRASPYGAEFIVFNATDAPLTMDSSTGNYLRINGITFTSESRNELTVDDYFNLVADYSHYQFTSLPSNATNSKNDSILIKNSRLTYGTKEFVLDAPYIQDRDTAYKMMEWMIQKIKKPKIAIGVEVFGLPIIQLGDIVTINYIIPYIKNNEQINQIQIPENSRFVVYSITHSANEDGIEQKLYLSEVP